MEGILAVKALILGIVEGLTEFLPVSSTGHLIVMGHILKFNPAYEKTFDVVIQLGAILAVCWEYRKRIVTVCAGLPSQAASRKFALNIIIATIPAVILGLSLEKIIKFYLFNPLSVACALLVGGGLILYIEKQYQHQSSSVSLATLEQLSVKHAFQIGLMQCLALIPGVSRSGATIMGGMFFGVSRRVATEFSFFLAIPIIFGATAYELYQSQQYFSLSVTTIFSLGGIAAFFSAFVCVRWLLRYVSQHSFNVFAWYRIIFALLIFALYHLGYLRF